MVGNLFTFFSLTNRGMDRVTIIIRHSQCLSQNCIHQKSFDSADEITVEYYTFSIYVMKCESWHNG